ncbi:hypothetical protein LCGC14_0498950 [marine sediment metagenome]|uniref:Uncharacterized protein n=1 Tax=marine sediment metagenome TaxID=412755 RepID=A0A0F9S4F1_9ZZZZ
MPKITKQTEKDTKSKGKQRSDEKFAFRSVIISAILGGIFYVISLIFNTELLTFNFNQSIIWNIVDILIKVGAILLFFMFMITSIGNYKELIGKPLGWKELLLLIIFSLGQALLNFWVFLFTFFGLILILVYLFLVQDM